MSLNIDIEEQKYGKKIVLKAIKTTFETGNIYGIVGKNGQGKTTFFKCILGLIKHKGEITFNDNSLKINQVAWCPTQPLIYDDLTASEFKDFYAELLRIEKNKTKDLFEINKNKLIKEFSTGMKKKAYLNAIFQKEFPIYILDEPFNGLDIESNYRLLNYLKEKAKNSIIIISSHILDSLYVNCASIYLIQDTQIKQFEKEKFKEIEGYLFIEKN